MAKRKIVFITGTRADFGKIKILIGAVLDSKKFDAHIFATGMHVLASYGWSVHEIEKCGFPNIYKFINHTGTVPMETILANTILGVSNFIKEYRPDMVVVHGDRVEALAGALAGSLNNIFVAHVEGGEISGTIDEHIRHAVSKISHLHFVANKEAKRRLIQMGEDNRNIFVVGSPDVDVMMSDSLPSLVAAKRRYGVKFKKYGILIYHSVTTELDAIERQGAILADALLDSDMNFIVVHPNNDPGTDKIRDIYNEKLAGKANFKMFESIRFEHFLALLRDAHFMIGNSSAGIREAPYYGVPSINVGSRQLNGVKNIKSIFNTDYDKGEILRLISKLSSEKVRFRPVKLFGDGNSHKKFLNTLNKKSIWNRGVQKQFRDVEFI